MRRILPFILLLISSAFSPLLTATAMPEKNLLIIGDSISAAYGINPDKGWVSLLANKITQSKKPYQVINASISGDTTANGLNRIKPLMDKYKPAIVIIELGGNDGLRGLSIKQMKNNLKKMIEISLKQKSRIILAGMRIPPNYGKRYTDAFYQVYQDLSKTSNIELIPFILEGIGDKSELMQADGIHPTDQAQPLIMQRVWEKLGKIL